MKRGDAVFLLIVLSGILLMGVALLNYASLLDTERATHCSEMLHKYSNGTLVPLTDDASVEIGACLLQFNQPLTGETK